MAVLTDTSLTWGEFSYCSSLLDAVWIFVATALCPPETVNSSLTWILSSGLMLN